jgi:hypothetical protein
MVDVDLNSTLPKIVGGRFVYKLKSFWAIKGSWTQKASKHLKDGEIEGNKGLCESGKWRCPS